MTEIAYTNDVEAILLAAGRPVTLRQIVELFEEHQRPDEDQVREALQELGRRCEDRAVELREVASGWRLQIRPKYADAVSRLWQERPAKYSRALLETLALIAYRQPITRSEIEDIRGVSVSTTIMRTLQERHWVRVVGHREVPGRPELLGTTREFLDSFGLRSLDELPSLAELSDLDEMNVQLELPAPVEGRTAAAGAVEAAGSEEEPSAAALGTQLDDATERETALQASPATDASGAGGQDESAATVEADSAEDQPVHVSGSIAEDDETGDDDDDGRSESKAAPSLVAAPPHDTER